MRDAGMKGIFFYEVFGLGTLDLTGSIKRNRTLIEQYASESTDSLRFGIAPHAPYTVTPSMGRMAAEMASKLGCPMSTHIAETRDEVEFFLHGTGRFSTARRGARFPLQNIINTSTDYFKSLNLLTDKTLVVHGVHLSDNDLNNLNEIGCTMVTCPTSNAKLGAGIARVGTWKNKGLNICIGTDSPASGETFDMFEEMRRFVLMQRGITGELDNFTAEEVLRMVTANPARALGVQQMVGDLREGSCADLILITPEKIRNRDPYDTLLWSAGADDIQKVWSDGREVYSR
jgi:5-methylthioadenosine/S-adenosylhomocysteine deaminase